MSATSNSFAALADAGEDVPVATTSKAVTKDDASTHSDEDDAGASSSQPGRKGKKLKFPLIWIDLEMTGLDISKDTIIELACIATDGELQTQIQGPALAIHHSDEVLENMNDWCKEHHGKSGLTQRVRDSKVTMEEAEQQLLAFIQQHADEGGAQLAGNSVHIDRIYLAKYMPSVVTYLSYRIVDVSSIKELTKRWFFNVYKKVPRKTLAHTALSDIRESIDELKYYRRTIFKDPRQVK